MATWEKQTRIFLIPPAIAVIALALWSLYNTLFVPGPDESRHHAFGCFVSDHAGTILLSEQGVRVSDGDNTYRTSFELEYHRGYVVVAGPLALGAKDGRYLWYRPERDWSYFWSFDGPEGFFSRHATDLEKLDVLEVLTDKGSAHVRFVRSQMSACQSP